MNKFRPVAGGVLGGVLVLSACGSAPTGSSASGTEAAKSTLTVATTDNIQSLDPASEFVGWFTSRDGVTETLIDVDDKLALVPKLASAWENADESTWKITLRDGVTFHNGAPVDAAAAKTSIEYAIKTNVRAKSQLPVESITAQGNVLTIRTSKPLPALPNILTDPMMGIQALGSGIDPKTKPIGTGPFKVHEHIPQQQRVLAAHAQYWGGTPKLSQVTVKQYADAQAKGLALQSGEADVVVQPDAAGLAAYSDTSKYTTWQTTSTRSDGVILNMESPVMKEAKAREAINFALDRNAYVSLMNQMAKATFVFFPGNVYFGGEKGLNVPVTGKDLTRAKELFKQAGYTESGGKLVKDGQPLTIRVLTYSSRPFLGSMAQVLQSDLRGIGATVEISEVKDPKEALKSGNFDLGMYSMGTAPTGDPEYFFDTMLKSSSETNYSRYKSAAFDAKLADLSKTFGSEKRAQKAKAAEQQLLNDMPYIMFGNQQWWVASTTRVHDLRIKPTEYHLLSHETYVG